MRRFWRSGDSTSKRVLDVLELVQQNEIQNLQTKFEF